MIIKIVNNEKEEIIRAAIDGKFGELDTLYTPFENSLLAIAGYVQSGINYLKEGSYKALEAPKKLKDSMGGLINIEIEREEGETPEETESDEEDNVVNITLLERKPREDKTETKTFYERVNEWVHKRVASELIERSYEILEEAEEILQENIEEIEINLDQYRERKNELYERSIEIGRDMGQKLMEEKQVVKHKEALSDDYKQARSIADQCFDDAHYGTPEAEEEAKRSNRYASAIEQELTNATRIERELKNALLRDKHIMSQLKGEKKIVEEGIERLEEVYATVQENKNGVITARATLEQRMIEYNAWIEAITFAKSVPQPTDIAPIMNYVETKTGELKGAYKSGYNLEQPTPLSEPIVQNE